MINELVYEIHSRLSLISEDDSVDRLEYDAVIVDVFDLAESVSCRMSFDLFRSKSLLDVFPCSLCGSEGVVAVSHGLEDNMACTVLFLSLVVKGRKSFFCTLKIFLCNEAACDVTAIHHEVSVVNDFFRRISERLDNRLVRIIDQDKNVRHLDRSVSSDSQARRYTLYYCALCCSCE